MKHDEEIERLEAKLAELKLARTEFNKLPKDKQIAIELHKNLCRWNHTDGCGWYYHEHNWNDAAHIEYLDKAKLVLKAAKDNNVNPDVLVKLIVSIR